MPRSMREYLQHILDETDYLTKQSRDVSRETFLQDETLKRAFVRSIEIIGEAVKKIPESVRQEHPEIDWRAVAGMRDRLIRGYFGVDYGLRSEAALEPYSVCLNTKTSMLFLYKMVVFSA